MLLLLGDKIVREPIENVYRLHVIVEHGGIEIETVTKDFENEYNIIQYLKVFEEYFKFEYWTSLVHMKTQPALEELQQRQTFANARSIYNSIVPFDKTNNNILSIPKRVFVTYFNSCGVEFTINVSSNDFTKIELGDYQ